ncbi:MAG: SoxR reducing system RseC family protein [Nitrospirae bacterium]|nr:SoxR reducing system RseC family protein [Nitrospirota bacterium]
MEEIGVVKSIDGVIAKVVVERKSICDKCTEGKCLLTEGGAIIEAFNQAKAKEGQRVRVVFRPYSYLKGSILIYGIPALALIIGAIIGREILSKFINTLDPDLLSAIGGFSLLIITFAIVRVITRRMEKKVEYKPVVEEILEQKQ